MMYSIGQEMNEMPRELNEKCFLFYFEGARDKQRRATVCPLIALLDSENKIIFPIVYAFQDCSSFTGQRF